MAYSHRSGTRANMPQNSQQVTLLGKTFTIDCAADEQAGVEEAAKLLQQRLEDIKQRTYTNNYEHLALMTALNLSHELLLQQQEHQAYVDHTEQRMKVLEETIRQVLEEQAGKLDNSSN